MMKRRRPKVPAKRRRMSAQVLGTDLEDGQCKDFALQVDREKKQ
jgi:hypothetical protein